MNIGMLWFDNDPKTEINTKIERAAVFYSTKYGQKPNLCFIHPSMLPGNGSPIENAEAGKMDKKAPKNGAIEVRTSRAVRPNHFWIGVNNVTPES